MYLFFSILFVLICISLIILVILTPSKNNIINTYTDTTNTNNIVITQNFLKNTLNYIITIFAITFYTIAIVLNILNNTIKYKNYYIEKKQQKIKINNNNKSRDGETGKHATLR